MLKELKKDDEKDEKSPVFKRKINKMPKVKNILSQSYNEPLHKTTYDNFSSVQHSPLKNPIFDKSFDRMQSNITRNLDDNKFQTIKDQENMVKERKHDRTTIIDERKVSFWNDMQVEIGHRSTKINDRISKKYVQNNGKIYNKKNSKSTHETKIQLNNIASYQTIQADGNK